MKAHFVKECVNPRTKKLTNVDDALTETTGPFLFAFYEIWREQGLAYDTLGDFFRAVSDSIEMLAWDWASMTDEGALSSIPGPTLAAHRDHSGRWAALCSWAEGTANI